MGHRDRVRLLPCAGVKLARGMGTRLVARIGGPGHEMGQRQCQRKQTSASERKTGEHLLLDRKIDTCKCLMPCVAAGIVHDGYPRLSTDGDHPWMAPICLQESGIKGSNGQP